MCKSIIDLKYRISRVTAAQFLHGSLNAVPGIAPVLIFIQIILLVAEPGNLFLEALHVFFHQIKENGIEFFLLPVVQLLFANLHQIPEMRKAEAFAVFEKICEFFAVFVHIKESVQIALVI